MAENKKDINVKIDEYHLMVEEVLGGMDMMVSNLETRVLSIEQALGIDGDREHGIKAKRLESFNKELKKLKSEVTEGFKLAFRKIAEK